MKYDVVVIGSGMSGLIAAAKAVTRNKRTLIITKGQGSLPLTSGCIDFWGYRLDKPKVFAPNPYEEIRKLAALKPEHPYAKVWDVLEDSTLFLEQILTVSNSPLSGSLFENQRVLTALGTERISALVPPSMVIKNPEKVENIIAVGFKNYLDFFPEMFLDNLSKDLLPKASKTPIQIDLGIDQAIKSTYLSLLLEREDVLENVAHKLRAQLSELGVKEEHHSKEKVLIVFPPVLGRRSDYDAWKKLTHLLAAQVIEVPGLPPSIPGQRLYHALTSFLKQRGVEFSYNTEVIDFTTHDRRITSVIIQDSSNTTHSVDLESVILATGSFVGGGLVAKKDVVFEPIFKLPASSTKQDSNETPFLSLEGQAFLSAGLEVDDQLRPSRNIDNLYAVGSILAHSNYASEKSGLGVALATGYKAGSLA